MVQPSVQWPQSFYTTETEKNAENAFFFSYRLILNSAIETRRSRSSRSKLQGGLARVGLTRRMMKSFAKPKPFTVSVEQTLKPPLQSGSVGRERWLDGSEQRLASQPRQILLATGPSGLDMT